MVKKVVEKKKRVTKKLKEVSPTLAIAGERNIASDFAVKVYDKFDRMIKSIVLFGSSAKAVSTPDSDIDMLVFFEPDKLTFDSYMDLTFFLEDLLHTNVDLLTPEQISPHIMPYIQKEIQYESL